MSRVVAVTPLYPPKSPVGAWIATHELLAELARRAHDVTVYRRLSESSRYELDGVDVRPGRKVDDLDAAISAADIVISHCGDDGMAPYLATRHGKPSVRMVHGEHDDAADRLKGSTLAVFNSHALAAHASWNGPQIVIHPPIRRDVRTTPGDRVTLVNLSGEKGGPLFWKVTQSMRTTRFLAVKGGWGLQPIFARSNVRVLPHTPRMAKVFGQTRILLVPSARETFGLVGVEAMSSGIPVIAHPTPGLRESLGDAGIFVDRDDPQGWIAEIERLADPNEWTAASAAALLRAEELEAEDPRDQFARALDALDLKAAA